MDKPTDTPTPPAAEAKPPAGDGKGKKAPAEAKEPKKKEAKPREAKEKAPTDSQIAMIADRSAAARPPRAHCTPLRTSGQQTN